MFFICLLVLVISLEAERSDFNVKEFINPHTFQTVTYGRVMEVPKLRVWVPKLAF